MHNTFSIIFARQAHSPRFRSALPRVYDVLSLSWGLICSDLSPWKLNLSNPDMHHTIHDLCGCPGRLRNGQWANSYFWKCHEACSSQAASSHLGPSLPGTRFTCLASHRNAVSTTDCNDAFNVAEFKHGHLSIE